LSNPLKPPNPQKVVEHVLTLLGGREKAFATFDADFAMIARLWNQNTSIIGRILRCHLFVEHFITEYLTTKHPALDFDKSRLTFSQKVDLVGSHLPPSVSHIIPGVRRLNSIRNRLSHTLTGEISIEDVSVFTSISLFEAMRREAHKPNPPSSELIVILESFAQHAGYALHSVSTLDAEVWSKAIDMASRDAAG
jgi:hypothetical protein